MRLHCAPVHFAAGPLWLGVLALLAAPMGIAGSAGDTGNEPPPPYKAPYIPAEDAALLQEVPGATDPAVREMRLLRSKLDADASNLTIAEQLAQVYIDFGRQIGDAHYAGYAEAVLAPWLQQAAPPAGVLVEYGTILQYRHQFAEARRELKRALDADPGNTQAWLTLATVNMVQGEYETARRDCAQVAAHGTYILVIACTANLRSYTGQAQQSLSLLTQIDGQSQTLPPALRAWLEGLLAEAAERLGEWAQAETHYRKALALTPQDNYLLVAYADFLLDRNRPAEVLPLLMNSSQSDTAFLRLALAKAALHSPELPRYGWIMGARFAAVTQRGSDYFGREQVRFALHLQRDPQAALDMAKRNWKLSERPGMRAYSLKRRKPPVNPRRRLPCSLFCARRSCRIPSSRGLPGRSRLSLKRRRSPHEASLLRLV